MKSPKDEQHRREHEAHNRKLNVWADKHGVKCTCGARSYGDSANHSSVCSIFKKYYKDWPRNESRKERNRVVNAIVDKLLS